MGKDYDLTYAPIMDAITYRYLIAFSLVYKLQLHLMDVVTTYLYGTLDTEIYICKLHRNLLNISDSTLRGEQDSPLSSHIKAGIIQLVPMDLQRNLLNKETIVLDAPNNDRNLKTITHLVDKQPNELNAIPRGHPKVN